MLARVAENMYWMARYLERAEDLARLIDVTTHLHLDLPRGSTPSWGTLLTLVGAEESYREKHGEEEDEARVLRFLLGAKDHPQSLRAAIAAARSNARGFREVFPGKPGKTLTPSTILARSSSVAASASGAGTAISGKSSPACKRWWGASRGP